MRRRGIVVVGGHDAKVTTSLRALEPPQPWIFDGKKDYDGSDAQAQEKSDREPHARLDGTVGISQQHRHDKRIDRQRHQYDHEPDPGVPLAALGRPPVRFLGHAVFGVRSTTSKD